MANASNIIILFDQSGVVSHHEEASPPPQAKSRIPLTIIAGSDQKPITIDVSPALFQSLRFDFAITKTEPKVPIENTPIQVFFSLLNRLGPTTSGIIVGSNHDGEVVELRDLKQGERLDGTIIVSAPKAGRAVTLQIEYHESSEALNITELSSATISAQTVIDVADECDATLLNFHINEYQQETK